MIAFGPILPENPSSHRDHRDCIAAMEKQLACDIKDRGYDVLNVVHCTRLLDEDIYERVWGAFIAFFPKK